MNIRDHQTKVNELIRQKKYVLRTDLSQLNAPFELFALAYFKNEHTITTLKNALLTWASGDAVIVSGVVYQISMRVVIQLLEVILLHRDVNLYNEVIAANITLRNTFFDNVDPKELYSFFLTLLAKGHEQTINQIWKNHSKFKISVLASPEKTFEVYLKALAKNHNEFARSILGNSKALSRLLREDDNALKQAFMTCIIAENKHLFNLLNCERAKNWFKLENVNFLLSIIIDGTALSVPNYKKLLNHSYNAIPTFLRSLKNEKLLSILLQVYNNTIKQPDTNEYLKFLTSFITNKDSLANLLHGFTEIQDLRLDDFINYLQFKLNISNSLLPKIIILPPIENFNPTVFQNPVERPETKFTEFDPNAPENKLFEF